VSNRLLTVTRPTWVAAVAISPESGGISKITRGSTLHPLIPTFRDRYVDNFIWKIYNYYFQFIIFIEWEVTYNNNNWKKKQLLFYKIYLQTRKNETCKFKANAVGGNVAYLGRLPARDPVGMKSALVKYGVLVVGLSAYGSFQNYKQVHLIFSFEIISVLSIVS